MLCNIALWDRALRFLMSILVLAYAIAGGPFWFYILGLYLLITAGWGLCPFYSLFRIRTLR
jgi:hypothetical protein